jgi:hypothetical protein
MAMEAVIRELQDTMAVMAHIQARQAAALKDQAEWLEGQQTRMKEQDRRVGEHDRQMERHDRLMAEFDDKLNGLISIVKGGFR